MADVTLRCDRCAGEATHFTLDGADSKWICDAWPKCPPTKWGVWFVGDCLTDPNWRHHEGTREPLLFDTQEKAFDEIRRLAALYPWRYAARPYKEQ